MLVARVGHDGGLSLVAAGSLACGGPGCRGSAGIRTSRSRLARCHRGVHWRDCGDHCVYRVDVYLCVGCGYSYAEKPGGPNDFLSKPPPSRSPASAKRLPLDAILAAAGENLPGSTLLLQFPRDLGGSIVVFGNRPSGPASDGVVALDPATGEVLTPRTTRQYPALKWWRCWNYPLHVGSILGVPTKIVWLLVCFGLMLLPITGTWMWWRRRPGSSGVAATTRYSAPENSFGGDWLTLPGASDARRVGCADPGGRICGVENDARRRTPPLP